MAFNLLPYLLQLPAYRRHVLRLADVAHYLEGKGFIPESTASEIENILPFLKANEVNLCIDAGANHGNYSHHLVRFFPNAEILAIEPSPINVEKLKSRFKDQERVSVLRSALCAKNEEVTLFSEQPGSSKASLTKRDLSKFGVEFECAETVPGRRFDDVWKDQLASKPIDLYKLDIEGHELEALEGSREALAQTKVVQFEFGGGNIDTRTFFRDFWDFFEACKFQIFRIAPFGARIISEYQEKEEHFQTCNYLAVKNTVSSHE